MRHMGVSFLFFCSDVYSASALGGSWSVSVWERLHSSFNGAEFLINRDNVWSLTPILSFQADGGLIASPTVINGTAYFGDSAGYFYAFHAFERRPLWRQFVGMASKPVNPICQQAIGVAGQAVVTGGVVYVPGGDSAVYALDQQTGSQLWRGAVAGPGSGSYLWSFPMLLNPSLSLGLASLGGCPSGPG